MTGDQREFSLWQRGTADSSLQPGTTDALRRPRQT